MSAYEHGFDREKAVLASAELLRIAGIAFFPLDIHRLLSAFAHQVHLFPYSIFDKTDKTVSNNGEKSNHPNPRTLSEDGFCTRIRDVLMDFGEGPVTGNNWNIYFNNANLEARTRFTIMYELGHVILAHHEILDLDTLVGMDENPEYRAADAQADQFSINALAPAPAVLRLLEAHGFSWIEGTGAEWQLTNRNAPFLRNLGKDPDPVELVITSFGLSKSAAQRRLYDLNTIIGKSVHMITVIHDSSRFFSDYQRNTYVHTYVQFKLVRNPHKLL